MRTNLVDGLISGGHQRGFRLGRHLAEPQLELPMRHQRMKTKLLDLQSKRPNYRNQVF